MQSLYVTLILHSNNFSTVNKLFPPEFLYNVYYMNNERGNKMYVKTQTKKSGKTILCFLLSFVFLISCKFPSVNINAEVILENDIDRFVNRMYWNVMNREPDINGFNHWTSHLKAGTLTAAELSESFLLSEEIMNKALSNEAYIAILYTTMMDRVADQEGSAFWQNYLKNGVTRTGILRQFLLTPEFQNICNQYGIKRGTPTLFEDRDENLHLTSFINRQYESILGRPGEPDGLDYWTMLILHQNVSVEIVAKNFLDSKEFKDYNHGDHEYIRILYRAFMGREGDASGISYWQDQLSERTKTDGSARQWIFENFVYSKEFRDIIISYGLSPSDRPTSVPTPSTPTPTPMPTPTPTGNSLAGKVIIIDAGHGGRDSGTQFEGKVLEKTLNLQMATLTQKELEAAGATVFMTRTDDSWVSLYSRIALAHLVSMKYAREKGISPLTLEEEAWYTEHMEAIRKKNATDDYDPANMGIMTGTGVGDELKKLFAFEHKLDKQVIYIAIHVNAAGSATNTGPRGLQVYFPTDDAIETSEINQENRGNFSSDHVAFPRRPRYDGRPNAQNAALANSLKNTILGQVPALNGNSTRTIAGNYAYLREHGLVCVMVETGFMTNPTDRELLQKPEVQAGIARGIRDGCIDYFSK